MSESIVVNRRRLTVVRIRSSAAGNGRSIVGTRQLDRPIQNVSTVGRPAFRAYIRRDRIEIRRRRLPFYFYSFVTFVVAAQTKTDGRSIYDQWPARFQSGLPQRRDDHGRRTAETYPVRVAYKSILMPRERRRPKRARLNSVIDNVFIAKIVLAGQLAECPFRLYFQLAIHKHVYVYVSRGQRSVLVTVR